MRQDMNAASLTAFSKEGNFAEEHREMNSSSVERFITSSNHALEIATAISTNKPIDRLITALVLKLQTTLDVNEIFQTFYETIKDDLRILCIEYEFPLLGVHINLGDKATNSYSYLLEVEDHTWGKIVAYRDEEFSQSEKTRFDVYISAVVFPLRNAVRHESALTQASNDSHLALPNWGHMESQLTREAKLAVRQKQSLCLVLINIDLFAKLKETYGSLFGDIIIRHVYETLQDCLRDTDILYRYGYDQFSLILNNMEISEATHIAERIRIATTEHPLIDNDGKKVTLSISIGITELLDDDTVDTIYERAFKALKLAKDSGGNQVKLGVGKFLR